MMRRVVTLKWTDVSKVRTASIIRAVIHLPDDGGSTHDVTTRRYIPEDSKLHTRRRENLKSHIILPAVLDGCDTWSLALR
jgi:hypothetical protein